jgi:hypothetical protein
MPKKMFASIKNEANGKFGILCGTYGATSLFMESV